MPYFKSENHWSIKSRFKTRCHCWGWHDKELPSLHYIFYDKGCKNKTIPPHPPHDCITKNVAIKVFYRPIKKSFVMAIYFKNKISNFYLVNNINALTSSICFNSCNQYHSIGKDLITLEPVIFYHC